MRPVHILAHVRREPFRPFRIHLSDGASYDVRHPEMALVTRSIIAIAQARVEGELPEELILCDPIHVTRIEPINGAKSRRGGEKQKR